MYINKKFLIIVVFLFFILILLISYMGCDIRPKPSDVRDNVWNYSKDSVNEVYKSLDKFKDFKPVVSHGMVTFNDVEKEPLLINSKTQKKLTKMNSDLINVIGNNDNELTQAEANLISSTLELIKAYYKLDFLIKQYNLSCLQIKSGIEFEEGNDKNLRKKREEIIKCLEDIKVLSNIFKELYNIKFDNSINDVIDKINSFK
ncbi:hypothetical protein SAMN05444401_4092 [Clostridium amylolyticum]|uniref:Uncharacterized protein n=1 Tax=Clostridium amylolyticum TaxID=1121298 RepID=A0A1M6MRI5_9CLOT|nr:hypothetical protein [Clostridium amylolyticum]SHJ86118.1 hypothetical protein SAMN05444401_4092 [Clostridium amylolyticum]